MGMGVVKNVADKIPQIDTATQWEELVWGWVDWQFNCRGL